MNRQEVTVKVQTACSICARYRKLLPKAVREKLEALEMSLRTRKTK